MRRLTLNRLNNIYKGNWSSWSTCPTCCGKWTSRRTRNSSNRCSAGTIEKKGMETYNDCKYDLFEENNCAFDFQISP